MTELQRMTHPEEGMVYACPHCDTTNVRNRKDGSYAEFDEDAPMACYGCHTGVYELVERESRSHTGPPPNADTRSAKHGKAVTLEAMTVEEFDAHLKEEGLA